MNMRALASVVPALLCVSAAVAVTPADVDQSFDPYGDASPSAPGLKPGMVINKSNAEQFGDLFDSATLQLLKKGDLEIPIEATHSVKYNESYIAATKKYAGQVKLGAKAGTLDGYVAGRPFPEKPDPNDPQAGEKLAFNYKYNLLVGDSGRLYPFPWTYKNYKTGNVERTLWFDFHFLNFKHRVSQEPVADIEPNPSNVYRGIYLKVLEPQDLKNTQLLLQRFDDDTKQDDGYLYLGFQRRVRRLSMAQTTDAFLGSDILIEDFEGYNGRVLDMTWKYVGTKTMLMPFYRHSDWTKLGPKDSDGFGMVQFNGQGGCYANTPWSLRVVHVVEGVPTNPANPTGKRVMYIDAQTSVMPMTLLYDKKGELWKRWAISFSDTAYHAPQNKNAGIAVYTSGSMIDLQAQHCTTFQPKVVSDPKLNPQSLFNVQNLRGGE
jgi:Protein of unknown function (DUF1329)